MVDKDTKQGRSRIPLILSAEEVQKLDDWQFKHRHRTRTAAIKALLEIAYEATASADPPPDSKRMKPRRKAEEAES